RPQWLLCRSVLWCLYAGGLHAGQDGKVWPYRHSVQRPGRALCQHASVGATELGCNDSATLTTPLLPDLAIPIHALWPCVLAQLLRPDCVTHRPRRVTRAHSRSGCSAFCCRWSTPLVHGTIRTVGHPEAWARRAVAGTQRR